MCSLPFVLAAETPHFPQDYLISKMEKLALQARIRVITLYLSRSLLGEFVLLLCRMDIVICVPMTLKRVHKYNQ